MEILKTKDYSQFKSITSNRDVNRVHVKKLSESIKARNLLWAKPPLVNEKNQIIDGQHRLEACELVKEPFFYLVAEGLNKQDMAILNTNQKNWTGADFINFYTIEGKKDYVELSKLINKYEDLKVSMLIAFASGGQQWGGGIKDGEFKATNMPRARQVCEWIMNIRKGHAFCLEKYFGMALFATIEKESDFQKLLKNSKKDSFIKCFSQPEYRKMILEHLK
mgnify:CR=1 FL=1